MYILIDVKNRYNFFRLKKNIVHFSDKSNQHVQQESKPGTKHFKVNPTNLEKVLNDSTDTKTLLAYK